MHAPSRELCEAEPKWPEIDTTLAGASAAEAMDEIDHFLKDRFRRCR